MEPIISTQSATESTSTAAKTTTRAQEDKAVVSSDFETFLRMLTAQVENQDPLNPVDSTDYATQLATFSGVEQQVLTNDLLGQMATLLGGGALQQMSSWIGKEALVSAPVKFDGTPITVRPSYHEDAETASLVVRNSNGDVVQSFALQLGEDSLLWAGTDENGALLPNDVYTFNVHSKDANGALLESPRAQVYSRVDEVRSEDGDIVVRMSDGSELPSTMITALRSAES